MKKLLRIILVAAIVIIVLGLVVGVFVMDAVAGAAIEAGVETVGPKATQTTVEVAGVSASVLGGSATLDDLVVGNPEGFKTEYAVRAADVRMTLDLDSLTSDTVVIEEIVVDGPEVVYELGGAGTNLGAIQRAVREFAGPPDDDGGDITLVIRNFIVKNGTVHVSATPLGGRKLTAPLPDYHLEDIGEKSGGATIDEVTRKILFPLFEGAREAFLDVKQKASDIDWEGVGESVKKQADGVKDTAKKALDDIKGVFGR